jgi:hypothetical protein
MELNMEQHHKSLKQPQPDAKLWRYLDFTKMVAMLESKALYFCSLANLDDPFEGSFPQHYWDDFVKHRAASAWPEFSPDRVSAELKTDDVQAELRKQIDFEKYWGKVTRELCFVNCWHVNEDESAAMWKLYLQSNEGIAIRSTFARLRESLEAAQQHIYFGVVQYLDYNTATLPLRDYFAPAFAKRRSYAHEAELRAMYFDVSQLEAANSAEPLKTAVHGYEIPVDVHGLIEKIHVAPTAPRWVENTIKALLAKYGFDASLVVKSDLASSPVW